jgi:MYXO-CTERM domain-containing protein
MVLAPDGKGSYADGTWRTVANSVHARSGATQHMLRDGRFFQAGGEYIDGPACTAALCSTAEIYDPVKDTWTDAATAPLEIADTGSANLADGRLIYSTRRGSGIQIYDPTTDTWSQPGNMPLRTGDENSWASLQNGGVLAVGFQRDGAAIYDPATNSWRRTGPVPTGFDTGDTGGITQMFDGRVLVYGLNFHSYIYTPGPTATDPGSWVEGPRLLDTEAEDEYSNILPNGLVMGGLVHVMFGPGTILQLFDPTTNTVSMATPPPDNGNPIPIDYVNLPNGQVLVTAGSRDWLYTPDGAPQDDWRPTVTKVDYDAAANTYTLTGTQISGLVNGADEGDDMTMAENYPIVWLTDDAGNVYYCRSFNFSSMFPSKGATPETCDFKTPQDLPQGSYHLFVSAVGVQSKNPFPFTVGQGTPEPAGPVGTPETGGPGSGGPGSGGAPGTLGSGGTGIIISPMTDATDPGGTGITGSSDGMGAGGADGSGEATPDPGAASGSLDTAAGAAGPVTSMVAGRKDGCSCTVVSGGSSPFAWAAGAFAALALAWRRTREQQARSGRSH